MKKLNTLSGAGWDCPTGPLRIDSRDSPVLSAEDENDDDNEEDEAEPAATDVIHIGKYRGE